VIKFPTKNKQIITVYHTLRFAGLKGFTNRTARSLISQINLSVINFLFIINYLIIYFTFIKRPVQKLCSVMILRNIPCLMAITFWVRCHFFSSRSTEGSCERRVMYRTKTKIKNFPIDVRPDLIARIYMSIFVLLSVMYVSTTIGGCQHWSRVEIDCRQG
jgi:hypothetical protein